MMEKKYVVKFAVVKQVTYGYALYVVGNYRILGHWDISRSLRMEWSEGHQWKTEICIPKSEIQGNIEFKYVIGKWNNPNREEAVWQIGQHNRTVELTSQKSVFQCLNKWNMEKITLILRGETSQTPSQSDFYVIGNSMELGNWLIPKKMKKCLEPSTRKQEQALNQTLRYTFEIYRGKSKIHYYYIKKNKQYTVQRHPGRKYYLGTKSKTHPRCLQISHPEGDTQILEQCNFNQLIYSKVNQRMFLGAHLKNSQDLLTLKQEGVNYVLGIQTQEDFEKHSLTSLYLHHICSKNSIEFIPYSIIDMNKKDFIQKCSGALQIMKNILQNKQNVIYVHCSAGVYRSAQLVVLYLTLMQHFSVTQAIQYVKQKHPVARPNLKIVQDALIRIQQQNLNHKY